MSFAVGSSAQAISEALLRALAILAVTVLPYLIWRLGGVFAARA
jgi:hypothetical protein